MRAQPIKIKDRRTRRLRNGVAAGILVLTMSVAGATSDADGQVPATKQTRLNKTLHWFEVGMASGMDHTFRASGRQMASRLI